MAGDFGWSAGASLSAWAEEISGGGAGLWAQATDERKMARIARKVRKERRGSRSFMGSLPAIIGAYENARGGAA
jgi:hypothetical protein